MKVTINLTKKEIEHLDGCIGHYDACDIVENIIEKIKKEIQVN